ncbi:MAG TPA: TlpA disulfide reductase family protein [Burkholderiales bacterium]|jgi:thiol-disulfide isomerase/thioredoxin
MTPGRREALILGAAGVAAAAAGFLVGPVLTQSTAERKAQGSQSEDDVLRRATLVDLAGKPRRLSEWQGRILVCNFWATWCAPCREEIPMLVSEREKYKESGIEIVGIAIDNAAKVGEFTASLKITYPILLAEADGLDLMRKLGNGSGGLPYTVVADRRGAVVHRKLGALREAELDEILRPLAEG